MGRQGGARRTRKLCARCAARTLRSSLGVCARPASRAPSRSPPPPLPPPALPSPSWRSLRRRHGRKAARLCRVLPCPGGDAGKSARENMAKGGYMRERMDEGSKGEGVRHFGATGALSAKSGACACARVRACVAVGGGVPGVLQHQTARRGGKRIRNDSTTADPTLNPSPAGTRAASPRTLPRASAPLLLPASSGHSRVWGLWNLLLTPLCPPAAAERRSRFAGSAARPEGASSCLAFREAPLLSEAGSVAGTSVM